MQVRFVFLAIFSLLICTFVHAQKSTTGVEAFHTVQANEDAFLKELGLNEQELYDLIQSYMLVRLQSTLELTDVQTLNLMKRIGEYKDKLPRLKIHKALLILQLRRRLSESAAENLIQENLNQLFQNDQRTVETLRKMITAAGSDLSTVQQAKLYLFVGDFEEDIRRMAMHAQRLNQEGHQRYTKEQHDRFHEMTDDDAQAFRAMIEERTNGLDINDPEDKNIIELVDAWLMVRLSSELALTAEETVRLFRRVGTYKDHLQQMKWKMGDARLALRIATRDKLGDDIIEEQIEDMLLREAAIIDLVETFVTEAQKDVSTRRAAQLFLFIGDFEQEVVDLIQRSITERAQ